METQGIRWFYRNKVIIGHDSLPKECTHIVYRLTFCDSMQYIGYKTVRSERRLKPTKAQLAIRKNYKRVEWKDLPFVDYVGSSKENEGKELVSKEIIYFCSNKRTATYLETKLLMSLGAIEPNSVYTNKNIGGKWFDNCLDGLLSNWK